MKNGQDKTIWKDISGNGNDGELINFDFDDKSGWTNNGLKFDGIDDKTNIDLQINQNDTFSIEQSFYIHEITGNSYIMFITTNSRSRDYGAVWHSNNNRIYFPYLFDRGVSTRKGIDYIIGHHHIAIIYDSQKQFLEVYHNGINLNLENKSPYEFTIDSIQPCWYTNTRTSMTLNHFRIYNRALKEEEVKQNYEASHFLLEPKTFTSNDYYNYYDLNRVELNTLATKDLAEILREDIDLENIDFDRNMKAFPFADILNKVERNIDKLGNELYKPKNYINPKLDWVPGMPFNYEDANRLERNLQLLYNYAKGNIDSIKYAGEGFVGKGVIF